MRAFFIETLYEWTKKPYQKWFKKDLPWNLSVKELIQYPKESLGFHLGCFLLRHDFSPQPKLENHDVFHVLTNTGITVYEEIAMQYYLFGNGKRSAYLLFVLLIGTALYPDKIKFFIHAYRKGKKALPFYQLAYQKLLYQSLSSLQKTFLITSI